MAETDLTKVIEAIMSHPEIISEIQGLVKPDSSEAKKDVSPTKEETKAQPNGSANEDTAASEGTEDSAEAGYIADTMQKRGGSARRGELLRALKPYVSEDRGKAIESMLTIADILDVMRKK